MNIDKADLIAMIRALPDDVRLSIEATQGVHRQPSNGPFNHYSPNGTMTLTIHVNGGAEDTAAGALLAMLNR